MFLLWSRVQPMAHIFHVCSLLNPTLISLFPLRDMISLFPPRDTMQARLIFVTRKVGPEHQVRPSVLLLLPREVRRMFGLPLVQV
jgi:hypothetical protein